MHFAAPFTAILGPNGAGKSTAVEAMKILYGHNSTESY